MAAIVSGSKFHSFKNFATYNDSARVTTDSFFSHTNRIELIGKWMTLASSLAQRASNAKGARSAARWM